MDTSIFPKEWKAAEFENSLIVLHWAREME
jgi:hypothetical protein